MGPTEAFPRPASGRRSDDLARHMQDKHRRLLADQLRANSIDGVSHDWLSAVHGLADSQSYALTEVTLSYATDMRLDDEEYAANMRLLPGALPVALPVGGSLERQARDRAARIAGRILQDRRATVEQYFDRAVARILGGEWAPNHYARGGRHRAGC